MTSASSESSWPLASSCRQEAFLQVAGGHPGRIEALHDAQDRLHDDLLDLEERGDFGNRADQQAVLVQAADDVLPDPALDALGNSQMQLVGQGLLPGGNVLLGPLHFVFLVVAPLVGYAAEPVLEAVSPVAFFVLLVGRLVPFGALQFGHGDFPGGLLVDFLFGLDFFQEGVFVQFLAEYLLKFQGGHLEQFQSLLKTLRHHQLLAQLHGLAQTYRWTHCKTFRLSHPRGRGSFRTLPSAAGRRIHSLNFSPRYMARARSEDTT